MKEKEHKTECKNLEHKDASWLNMVIPNWTHPLILNAKTLISFCLNNCKDVWDCETKFDLVKLLDKNVR